MSEDWEMWLCVAVYSASLFLFGFWVEYKFANFQLKHIVEASFANGCQECGKFEKDACTRDNTLSGVPDHPQPIP